MKPSAFSTEDAGGVALLDRVAHDAISFDVFAADIDERGGGLNRHAGDHDAFENLEGIAFKDLPVLEGTRLAFVGVDGEIARTAVGRRHEGPLETGRETGAAASAQARLSHQRGDCLGFHRAGLDHGLLATGLAVDIDG